MLYSRYANPKELMNAYIKRGRFCEFVDNVIEAENQRRKEEAEKEENNRLWSAYIRSMTEKSFSEWKKGLYEQKQPESYSMTNEQIADTKAQAKDILKKISPA